jgi:serine/threonine-protein kinase
VVKYFSPSKATSQGRFRFRAEAIYHFGRPDIQDALDLIENEKGLFLIKTFIPGKSLKNVKPFDISFTELKEALLMLADTLEFLHGKGIVHADIKPANIIWPRTEGNLPERPVLIDFGLARWNQLTYSDSLFSFIYAAPELVLGMNDKIGPWTDFFSLGVVLYEVIRGEPAYDLGDRQNLPAWLEQAQVVLPFEKDDRIPKDWFEVISKMCAKPAFRRPPASYSQPEREHLVQESINRRPQHAEELRKMISDLSTDHKRKRRWRFLGL